MSISVLWVESYQGLTTNFHNSICNKPIQLLLHIFIQAVNTENNTRRPASLILIDAFPGTQALQREKHTAETRLVKCVHARQKWDKEGLQRCIWLKKSEGTISVSQICYFSLLSFVAIKILHQDHYFQAIVVSNIQRKFKEPILQYPFCLWKTGGDTHVVSLAPKLTLLLCFLKQKIPDLFFPSKAH